MNTFPPSSDCECQPCPDVGSGSQGAPGPVGPTGPAGSNGSDGTDAFSTTTAGFTMPAVSGSVTITVDDSEWMAVGQVVYVTGAGYFSVNSTPTTTSASLTNLGYTGNVVPTTNVAGSKKVSPGGVKGNTGSNGSAGSLSPTTTKGDIIVDNGANSPASNVVRLAAGTNGQALVSDSTQATGVKWGPITPNTVANDNNIPRFDGVAGTPLPLQDSKLLITDDGAIQSTPSGGNARGSKAVDLQVDRAVATQVASGANATICGGKNNTAIGANATVAGGAGNTASNPNSGITCGSANSASGDNSFIGGGASNITSATNATVCAGNNNQAIGSAAFVGGGTGNVSNGNSSTIVGGDNNAAGNPNSSIGGGSNNETDGDYSTIVGGKDAQTDKYGQSARSSGMFAARGDAQASDLIARRSTTNATASTLFLDGASLRLVIPLNASWAFDILLVGRSDAGVTAVWSAKGGIQNVAGTVTMVAACTAVVLADGTGGTWGVAGGLLVTADNVNKALNLVITGANPVNIHWVAKISLVEVVF